MNVRPAVHNDVPALEANLAAGFETYREFAPQNWVPPKIRMSELFQSEGTRCWVGEVNGGVVAHVLYGRAMSSRYTDAKPIPGMAHLQQLFVRQAFWGTGLATDLLAAAVAGMEEDGYGQARLFTPAQQARARRFYSREGWTLAAEPRHEPGLGLGVVELRRWIGE